jgi:glycyl-tRNA synthetase
MSDIYDNVMELARRRGFIWPAAECYGSVAGFIDYGPLGAMMKRRMENLWRDFYVIREGYYEIESPTIGIEPVFVASGHVKGFSDKMCQCPHCGEYLRADHTVVGAGGNCPPGASCEEIAKVLHRIPCPSCGTKLGPLVVYEFNLMFQTTIGPGSQRKGYLRPETAQGMFTDFSRLLRFYRDKLPFGAVQIGKSYRNEISPRQGMIRLREFTQAEAEIFVHPEKKNHPAFCRYASYEVPLLTSEIQKKGNGSAINSMEDAVRTGIISNEYVAYYVALTHDMLVRMGMKPERIRFRQHLSDERAHYATDCWDAEFYSDRFGWIELVGIADRTDYDLRSHATHSGLSFTVFLPYDTPRIEKRRKVIPRMGILGPRFRNRAGEVAAALEQASPDETGITIELDGEEVLIPPNLYEVREETVEIRGEDIVPHVIEPSYGIDRMLYAVLEHSYAEEMVEGEVRKVLRLPPWIAPVQVAVFPLMPRDGLEILAREIADSLTSSGLLVEYDENGAIGRRYRRQDEVGTPYAVTVDYETKENHTVTIRDRDSMQQIRVPVLGLEEFIRSLVSGATALEF